jgi:acyl carrier protein
MPTILKIEIPDEEYREFATEAELVAYLKTNFSATIKS